MSPVRLIGWALAVGIASGCVVVFCFAVMFVWGVVRAIGD